MDAPSVKRKRAHNEILSCADSISYLEGPWAEMPHELVEAINVHLANGGQDDFRSVIFKKSQSLAESRGGSRAHFELKGDPNKALASGRFAYGSKHQIVIVGTPEASSPGHLRPAIFVFRHSPILDPNGHKGCFGNRWTMWQPIHQREDHTRSPYHEILRIYLPDTNRSSDLDGASSWLQPGGTDTQDTPDTHKSPTVKRRKLILRLRPASLASIQSVTEINQPQHDIVARPVVGIAAAKSPVPPPSKQAYQQRSSVSSDIEMIDAVVKRTTSALVRNAPPRTLFVMPIKTEAGLPSSFLETPQTEMEHAGSSGSFRSERRSLSSTATTTVTSESEQPGLPLPSKDNDAIGPVSDLWVTSDLAEQSVPLAQTQEVIVIEDSDDEVVIKEEDQMESGNMAPPLRQSIARIQPAFGCSHSYSNTGTTVSSTDLYEKVKIEFRDSAGVLRCRKPFRLCLSARDRFDTALEAEIIDLGARMFIVQIGSGVSFRMRADVEDSFQEKLIKPLNGTMRAHRGMIVTVRVRGFV